VEGLEERGGLAPTDRDSSGGAARLAADRPRRARAARMSLMSGAQMAAERAQGREVQGACGSAGEGKGVGRARMKSDDF
jgi:hypothetical protein